MNTLLLKSIKPGMICETFEKEEYIALTQNAWFCAKKSVTKTTNEIYYLGRKIKASGKIIAKRKNPNKDWELN